MRQTINGIVGVVEDVASGCLYIHGLLVWMMKEIRKFAFIFAMEFSIFFLLRNPLRIVWSNHQKFAINADDRISFSLFIEHYGKSDIKGQAMSYAMNVKINNNGIIVKDTCAVHHAATWLRFLVYHFF